jgi:hypothetical protein
VRADRGRTSAHLNDRTSASTGSRLGVLVRPARKSGRFSRSACFGLSLVLVALTSFSCTNNLSDATGSGSTGSGSGSTFNSTTSYILNVTNVVKDSINSTTTLDVVGDGSGAMGTYCISTSQSSTGVISNTGPSSCSCTYSYTSPSEGTAQVDVPTTYQEQNLIECLYTSIPTDVTTVQVSVHVTTQNAYSNAFSFNLTNTNGTNPTLISNFALVTRWQCRDIVSIPYPGSPAFGSSNSIYDPIQSQDPSLTYPIDFYTTNLGGSLEAYISANLAGEWNCPTNPNDPNFGLNYTLYSVGPDSAGSYEIYPPAGSAFDRSTFYVSKTQSGVYTIPLDSYTAPTLVDDGAAPLGYAAAPIVSGTNTETCPDVAIPSGYHWAKLWLFRASLPDRYYLQSTAMANAGTIACDPGQDSSGNQVFTDCAGGSGDINSIKTAKNASGSSTVFDPGDLVNRVIAGEGGGSGTQEACVQLSAPITTIGSTNPTISPTCSSFPTTDYCFEMDNYGPGATYDSATSSQITAFDSVAVGTDMWLPIKGFYTSGFATDPLGLLNSGTMNSAPKDLAPTSVDLDNPAGSTTTTSRYDFVFVVSPVTVMAADMENSSTTTNYPYVPFRFPSATDCLSPNPNNPLTAGDCNPSKIIHYGLKLHDVDTNGDPPANDTSDPPIYPMCVLQPNST